MLLWTRHSDRCDKYSFARLNSNWQYQMFIIYKSVTVCTTDLKMYEVIHWWLLKTGLVLLSRKGSSSTWQICYLYNCITHKTGVVRSPFKNADKKRAWFAPTKFCLKYSCHLVILQIKIPQYLYLIKAAVFFLYWSPVLFTSFLTWNRLDWIGDIFCQLACLVRQPTCTYNLHIWQQKFKNILYYKSTITGLVLGPCGAWFKF